MARKNPAPAAPKAAPAKRKRAAKADPLASPANSGPYLAAARAAGLSWSVIGKAIAEANGKPGGEVSAIPLRVTLRAFLAANPTAGNAAERAKVAPLPKTPEAVRAARDDRGEGFPLIAARTGLSDRAVRDLYAKAPGRISPDGRVYVGAAGRTLVRKPGESEPIVAAKPKRTRKPKAAAPAKAAPKAAAKPRTRPSADPYGGVVPSPKRRPRKAA